MQINDIDIVISNSVVRKLSINDEWFNDIEDPVYFIEQIKRSNIKSDIFSFWQRLPDVEPRFSYYFEWDSVAAIPLTSFDDWWKKRINSKTRNMIRKSREKGVVVRQAQFDDKFIIGMSEIFNETAIRQGKLFWHYGKNFEKVKREFSRNLFRENLLGAYYQDDLIGFIMLANAGKYAMTTQIISKIAHRDKAPNNALIAKAVQICCEGGYSYLVYSKWNCGSLCDFKRHNGFEKINLPRYYVPLTLKGEILLRMKLHHGLLNLIPEKAKDILKRIRSKIAFRATIHK